MKISGSFLAQRISEILMCTVILTSLVIASDGFGAYATGGEGGTSVTVTDAAALISYAQSPEPYIITVSGTITFAGYIDVAANKTIQGSDTNATINADLRIGPGVRNVIVRNLNFTNPSRAGDGDGLTIYGAKNVFVTHCTFTDCADGMCDITQQADSVTLSWCRFRYVNQTSHRNVNLIGSSDTAPDLGYLHVTIHHCWYDQSCNERMPSVRFGRVHVYNNYYSSESGSYGVRTRLYAECLVENNYFEKIQNPWELLRNTGIPDGKLFASNNNVAYLDSSLGIRWREGWYTAPGQISVLIPGTDTVFIPPYTYVLDDAVDAKNKVMAEAGNTKSGTDAVMGIANRPSRFTLHQNYPNPFNPATVVSFQLPVASTVSLKLYDILGREVATLVSEILPAGNHSRQWNASGCASGVYYYRLEAGSFIETRKLLLLK